VAIEGAGQHLHGGDEEAVGLREQGDGGGSSKSMLKGRNCGDMRAKQEGEAKVECDPNSIVKR
jgi:hypothetical protein